MSLGRTFQRMELFRSLIVRENVALAAESSHVGEISTGQGRLVELARALARSPRILLLDEPSSGLDVKESEAFGELLCRVVVERNIGILMIEHDMRLVLKICDPINVLDFGKPLMVGAPHEVRSSEAVRDPYLGKAGAA